MFAMEIALNEPDIPKAHYASMRLDDIYPYLSVEGTLTVAYNDQIVFSEDIAAVEFYWYLANWYRAESIKRKIPFRYTTIEYFEPILSFSYSGENQWNVESPWIKSSPLLVPEALLESQVQKLVSGLAAAFEPYSDNAYSAWE